MRLDHGPIPQLLQVPQLREHERAHVMVVCSLESSMPQTCLGGDWSVDNDSVRFRSVDFLNFKALRRFALRIEHTNLLVGPNNAGKSTIIDAFRLLNAGLRAARSRHPGWIRDKDGLFKAGYRVPVEVLSISMENMHTDYDEIPSTATFTLSNGHRLQLYVPADDPTCFLLALPEDRVVNSAATFKSTFPIDIAVVPVLGPVEHDEDLVQEETVRRNLETHRASRNFRNYWYWRIRGEGPEGFEAFRHLLHDTWPGMDIKPPELNDRVVHMYCSEERMDRELFWSGFGFQVWCQLLTHLTRSSNATIAVVDEAELYLHPDLQRQLVSRLRSLGCDVMLATHSSEIVTEADPDEVVIIDKRTSRAKRVTGAEGVRDALAALGSSRNILLSHLARTGRALLLEGEDFKILRQYASKLGFSQLATGLEFAVMGLGGSRDPKTIHSICEGMERALSRKLVFAAVLDRDYRTPGEVSRIQQQMNFLHPGHVLAKKEIENYLLVPAVLDRALASSEAQRAHRAGERVQRALPPANELLVEVTDALLDEVEARIVSNVVDEQKLQNPGLERSTIFRQAKASFRAQWADLDQRLDVVPGKQTLSHFNGLTQDRCGLSLTTSAIIRAFHPEEIPHELKRLLRSLDTFRQTAPPEDSGRI